MEDDYIQTPLMKYYGLKLSKLTKWTASHHLWEITYESDFAPCVESVCVDYVNYVSPNMNCEFKMVNDNLLMVIYKKSCVIRELFFAGMGYLATKSPVRDFWAYVQEVKLPELYLESVTIKPNISKMYKILDNDDGLFDDTILGFK